MSGPTTRPWGYYDDRHVHVRDVKLLSETEKALLVHLPRMVDAEWFPRAHVALLQENGKPAWLRVAAWLARERVLVRRLDAAHADLSKLPVMELDKRGVYAPTLPPLADVELWILQTALSPLDEGIAWMRDRDALETVRSNEESVVDALVERDSLLQEAKADLREERAEVARLKAELDLARGRLVAEQDAHRRVRARLGELARQRGANRDAVVNRNAVVGLITQGAAFLPPPSAAAPPPSAAPAAVSATPEPPSAAGATVSATPEPDDAVSMRFAQLELDEERAPGPGQNKK